MEVEGGRRRATGKRDERNERRDGKGGTGKEDGVRSAIEESSDLGSV